MTARGNDGRFIDAARGTLSGEASEQRVRRENDPLEKVAPEVFRFPPSRQAGLTSGDPTYFDLPVLKKSPWSWDIPAYYWTGGVTGAIVAFGAAATLLDRDGMPRIVKISRWTGPLGSAVCAVFLIHDLGRPERFFHMLRVFRPTSPMSVGTYILASFSSVSTLAWLTTLAGKRFDRAGDSLAVAAGVLGVALSGYAGVLVSNTAVPVWQRPHRIMPVLFLCSAVASAASLLELAGGNKAEMRAARVFGIAGTLGEMAATIALEQSVASVPEVVKPLREGFSGALWQAGKILSGAGFVLSLVPRPSRKRSIAIGILGTVGSICTKFGIHYAGQRSAMNPRATFHQQRAGQGAFEVTGKFAVTGPDEVRA